MKLVQYLVIVAILILLLIFVLGFVLGNHIGFQDARGSTLEWHEEYIETNCYCENANIAKDYENYKLNLSGLK